MAVAPWKDKFPQFKASEKSLEDLLLSGELPEAEYMKWAAENYKIPFLADDFFQQTKNYKLILENPNAAWNDYFFPIYEWQGMLYVGCLEPKQFTIDKKFCMVLCSAKQLLSLWMKMEKPSSPFNISPTGTPELKLDGLNFASLELDEKTPPPTFAVETPTAPQAPAAAPHAHAPAPQPSVKPAQAAVQVQPHTTTPPVRTPAPTQPITAQPPNNTPAESTQTTVMPMSSAHKVAAATNVQKISTAPSASAPTTPAPSVVEPPQTLSAITPPAAVSVEPENEAKPVFQEPMVIPTSHTKQPGLSVNPNFTPSNYNIPEITNVVKAGGDPSKNTAFTSTKTIMPFPDRTTEFTFVRTVYSEQVILEAKAKVQENTDPQEALMSAFRILKDYYKKLMWIVRDQKGHAFPIACNAEWEFAEEAWNLPMDFKTPNPFRIAKLTQKPFHGPVSANPASQAFFQQWNSGEMPNVMTIVPVKLHGKVFGYFIGCDKGAHFHPKHSVELMESVCNELIEVFVRIHKELNKAS